jgi:hypothetical protein
MTVATVAKAQDRATSLDQRGAALDARTATAV